MADRRAGHSCNNFAASCGEKQAGCLCSLDFRFESDAEIRKI
jgi:hypothetical protein